MEAQKVNRTYQPKDRVQINTANADGSIPSLPDYRATIEKIVDDSHVVVVADDGDIFSVNVGRLTYIKPTDNQASKQ